MLLSASPLAIFTLLAGGSPAADEPGKNVAVTEVKYDDLDKAITATKGKVVLVDFWATWCGPCVKKFPHFVSTQKKYKDKGLTCMSVSMDREGPAKEYDKEKVLKFLKEKEAVFPNYILLDYKDTDAKITKRFGLDGGIPFKVLFGKDGKKVWDSEEKELKDEELDKLIEAELAK
jgi:thiol-disulfide isomerase/thioredoxin